MIGFLAAAIAVFLILAILAWRHHQDEKRHKVAAVEAAKYKFVGLVEDDLPSTEKVHLRDVLERFIAYYQEEGCTKFVIYLATGEILWLGGRDTAGFEEAATEKGWIGVYYELTLFPKDHRCRVVCFEVATQDDDQDDGGWTD